jgi:CelD/BcsL family acetyltransferase involved in cellulose biosynthesis
VNGCVLPLRAISPGQESAWRDLASRAIEPNPFFEPECLIPAARFQTFGDELALVVAEEEGRFFGCVPVRHVKHWHKMPYPIVTSQVRRMPYQGTPLVDPDRGVEAAAAILGALEQASRATGSRVFVLLEITRGGPVDSYFRQGAGENRMALREFDTFERGIIDRKRRAGGGPAGEDAIERRHSAKTIRALRAKRRRLADALGSDVAVVDRGHDLGAIEDYMALEASGYKADHGVAMVTAPGEPEYFRAMCEAFAKADRLHLISLVGGGRTVAMMVWVRGGNDLFQIKWSYDATYARHSPGIQLHMEGMRHFWEHDDAALLDTCTCPENALVLGLYPDRRTITSFFVFLRRSWLDRAAMEAFLRLRPLHTKAYRWVNPSGARRARQGTLAPGMAASPDR